MKDGCHLRIDLTFDRTALARVLVEVFGRGMDVASLTFRTERDRRVMFLSLDLGSIPAPRAIALIERLVPVRSVTVLRDERVGFVLASRGVAS